VECLERVEGCGIQLFQLFPLNLLKAGSFGLLHIFESNDFYLCNLLGIRSAGLQNLDLLVNVGRVKPPAAVASLADISLLPDPKMG